MKCQCNGCKQVFEEDEIIICYDILTTCVDKLAGDNGLEKRTTYPVKNIIYAFCKKCFKNKDKYTKEKIEYF